MQIVILGAGGLGSVIGGYLARAGNDVTLIGRPAHVRAIHEHGLHISGLANFMVNVKATANPAEVTEAELLLLFVKTRDTAAALDGVRHIKVEMAASCQNGVVKDEQLAAIFGRQKVLGATTIVGATLAAPGAAVHTGDGYTFLGELGGAVSPRVERVVQTYLEAGLRARAVADIVSAEWSKLCQVCPAAAVSAMTRLPYYKVCQGEESAHLFVAITKECAAVAQACGVSIADYPGFNVQTLAEAPMAEGIAMLQERGRLLEQKGMTGVVISMLQDILAGKKTENEEIAGYVAARAREKGVPAPNTEFAYRAVRAIEAWL